MQYGTGAAIGIIAFICGLPWQLLIVYAILMAIDIISGVFEAFHNNDWSSKTMKQGLFKKGQEVMFIIAIFAMQYVALSVGIPVPLGSIIVGCFCVKEFGSIMENYIGMGNNVPDLIKNWFKITQDKIK